MKMTRKQWLMVLLGVLIIILLWYMSLQKGTSGQGADSDTGEDTSEGDATLAEPTENAAISARAGQVGATGTASMKPRREVLI